MKNLFANGEIFCRAFSKFLYWNGKSLITITREHQIKFLPIGSSILCWCSWNCKYILGISGFFLSGLFDSTILFKLQSSFSSPSSFSWFRDFGGVFNFSGFWGLGRFGTFSVGNWCSRSRPFCGFFSWWLDYFWLGWLRSFGLFVKMICYIQYDLLRKN